ncbi:transcription termination factor MTERF15, mitochondrial-like [Silene latifolia]|uniref:transcription termination factor MTERF15, mitochondrial-like n=1 Tax=Silene latifolia TaxID=37657 RepID=UPI003D787D3B
MLSIRCKSSIQVVHYVNNFQRFNFYSTKSPNQTIKSPNQSYTNYLVNNLGFSHQQALSTSTKLRSKNPDYFKSSDNANSVVDFLKQYGFDDTHIKKVVSSYPQILASNVDKTLKPKFKLLQDHGFSGSDLVSIISSSSASLVSRNMDHIIHDLRGIMGSNENLIKFFRRSHFFMNSSGLLNLNSNIALLINEYGLDIGVIRNGILQYPGPYLGNTDIFRNLLVRVEEELRIPRNSGMFLYGIRLLSSSSKQIIESKCQVLKSFGWTEYDVSELIRRNPHALLISEENIRQKLGFLMTELGYKPDFLAKHAVLLGCSLEKRMVPRHRVLLVLKEKGLLLDYNFYTAIIKTEKQFLKTLIEPFKEDAPGLLELYQGNKGCSNIDAIARRGQVLSTLVAKSRVMVTKVAKVASKFFSLS